jgi:WD40 repeat protein
MITHCVASIGILALMASTLLPAGELRGGHPADGDPGAAPVRLGTARFSNLGRVFALAFSSDGRLLASGAWDGSIRVFEIATGKQRLLLHEHAGPVRKLAFSRDGHWLASAGKAPGVCLWDLQSGKLATVLGSAKNDVGDVDISPDGMQVAANVRGTLHVWDRHGKELWSQGDDRLHLRLAFHGDDALTSIYLKPVNRARNQVFPANDSHAYLTRWELPSGKEAQTRDLGQLGPRITPSLGPGGLVVQHTVIQFGRQEAIGFLRTEPGQPVRNFDLAGQNVSALAISPDGRMLALTGDAWAANGDAPKFIRVFEIATGQERCSFQSLDRGQLSLAFSPDGRTLGSGSLDVTVLLWDLTRGEAKEKPVADAELVTLWNDLKGPDAVAAYRAHWKLVAGAEQAVPFVRRHLRPAAAPDPKRLAALVRNLGDDQFETRRQAHAELRKFEDLAEPALRAGLRTGDSLEVQRRIEDLLKQIDQVSSERLAQLRAIEALEHMQSSAAGALLHELAQGFPAASATRAAAEACGRLKHRP